jgi:hypothetical protein
MDDLTGRLADLFRRYQIDFGRMDHLSEAEIEQTIAPFLKEVSALIDEHGREAVLRAALLLPMGLPILHWCPSFFAAPTCPAAAVSMAIIAATISSLDCRDPAAGRSWTPRSDHTPIAPASAPRGRPLPDVAAEDVDGESSTPDFALARLWIVSVFWRVLCRQAAG